MAQMLGNAATRRIRAWPWAGMAILAAVATWHVVDMPSGVDGEFPEVERPVFSRYPPSAYRLAEPGDTIDRLGLYASSACLAAAALGLVRASRAGGGTLGWVAAIAASSAASWFAATPWPTFDGWHGVGWRVVLDPSAPPPIRLAIGAAAVVLAVPVAVWGWRRLWRLGTTWAEARRHRVATLGIASAALVLVRLADWPDVEPFGYWPRWAFASGMIGSCGVLARCLPERRDGGWRLVEASRWAAAVAMALGAVAVGLEVIRYHRPIDRLREVVPGRIFISAFPDPEGLAVAHRRHGFKTIINLFQEDLPGLRHPLHEEELAFVRSRGIDYIGSPLGVEHADAFLSETLRLAQDPDAWPILVHCHACMDRTPAWWGIYSFLVEGTPLTEVMRNIERHRGSRPKASVTLLYNRVLAERAPGRYRADPAAVALRRAAEGTVDPFHERLAEVRRAGRTDRAGAVSGVRR